MENADNDPQLDIVAQRWPDVTLDEAGRVLAALAEAGVSARRGIMASHRQPAYLDRDTGSASLAVTERLTDNTLILPLYHQMTETEQARVVDALRAAVPVAALA